MSTTNPVFSESTVIAAAAISVGAAPATRGTLDLTADFGANLYVRVGFRGTTAWDYSLTVHPRPVLGGGSGTNLHPATTLGRNLSLTAATALTTISTNASAGATSIVVTSGTGFAAKDLIMIEKALARLEFCRVSKVSGNTLYLDAPLRYAHTAADADNVSNGAQIFPKSWLEGGSLWELIVDAGQATTGSAVVVEAFAVTYTNDVTV